MAQSGPKMSPRMLATIPKTMKNTWENQHFGSWTASWLKMAQEGPKIAHDSSEVATRWLKMAPRWPGWPQEGPKMAPRWPQDGPKTASKIMEKTMEKRVFLLSGCILTPRWPKKAPRWPKMAPRWPQGGPKLAQDSPRWPQKEPRWRQHG